MLYSKEETGYCSFGKLSKWSLVRSAFVFLCSITLGWIMMGIFPAVG